MTQEEIYQDFCKKVQSGEYKISQVTRSNQPENGLQDFGFTLKKNEKKAMSKQADMGNGFVMNKEKGIMKDGKVVFTQEQLAALILFYDFCKTAREEILQKKIDKVFDSFFGGKNDD